MVHGAETRATRAEVVAAWDAADREPDNVETWRALARQLVRGGRPCDALAALERIAGLCPTPDTLFDLGVAHLDAGLYTFAAQAFRLVTGCRPEDPDAWGLLGICCVKLIEYEEALDAFTRATNLDREYMAVHPAAAAAEREALAVVMSPSTAH
jgi:Flp pilus assembly protein TadD